MSNPERAPTRLHHEPEAVRWAREKAGLTQTQLAERAELSRTLIVEIEAGTRNLTPANLLKVAAALNCPPVVLERKREPQTTPPAAVEVRSVRSDERAVPPQVPQRLTAPQAETATAEVARGDAVGGAA